MWIKKPTTAKSDWNAYEHLGVKTPRRTKTKRIHAKHPLQIHIPRQLQLMQWVWHQNACSLLKGLEWLQLPSRRRDSIYTENRKRQSRNVVCQIRNVDITGDWDSSGTGATLTRTGHDIGNPKSNKQLQTQTHVRVVQTATAQPHNCQVWLWKACKTELSLFKSQPIFFEGTRN